MSRSQFGNIEAEATALLSAWNDDTGTAFERETEKILSEKLMNAALDAITGMTEESFSIFEAVRNRAGTVHGTIHDDDGPLNCRTDLFAFTIQGSADDISNAMLGALPSHLTSEMKNTGYANPDSTILIFAAPLDPDCVSRITPDMLRWLTLQAQEILTTRTESAAIAIRRALMAFQMTPPPKSGRHSVHEAVIIGARLLATRQNAPEQHDLLCPDRLNLQDDETKTNIAALAERLSLETEKYLTEARMSLLVTQPLNLSHALNECAARRIAGWFAVEAITLGLPYEGDIERIFMTQDGEYIMASAMFHQHLLGPIGVHRMLGGTDLEELALSITNDIDKIALHSPSAEIPEYARTVN